MREDEAVVRLQYAVDKAEEQNYQHGKADQHIQAASLPGKADHTKCDPRDGRGD
jgi:hypothetical protein